MQTRIYIRGNRPLKGKIAISGAKNAALPILAATLLSETPITLLNVPRLNDIYLMCQILEQLGAKISFENNRVVSDTSNIFQTKAEYDLVKQMRASILVLGPLLARFGRASVSLPGGCSIGTRPVDIHIKGLQQMGAEIELKNGYIEAKAPYGLKGALITMPVTSVTATENLMMAATLCDGETQLIQAAREPEITNLAEFLISLGADIKGVGTDHITIQGCKNLKPITPIEHEIIPDRIEAGTYAIAAAITKGEIELSPVIDFHMQSLLSYFSLLGIDISCKDLTLKISATSCKLKEARADVMTEPFPGFPTDLQAQWMALMSITKGSVLITETIFENRFMHVPELLRMGADITVHGRSALVRGVKELRGAQVMSSDLRASVSLVLAGLAAHGETELTRIYHLDRGYENLEEKLKACGADIERQKN